MRPSLVEDHNDMTQMDPGGIRASSELTRRRPLAHEGELRPSGRSEPVDPALDPGTAAGDEPDPGTSWWPVGALLFGVAAIIGLLVRWWQITGRAPSWWQDSTDYETSSQASLASVELWAGSRSPGVPLALKVFGGRPGTAYIHFQIVLAALCWAWLAATAATVAVRQRGRSAPWAPWARWAIALLVVAFPLARPITMWDHSVLSESLTTSLFAALVAAALWFVRRPTPLRVLAVVAVAGAWVATRDANVLAIAVVAVGLITCRLVAAGRAAAAHRPVGRAVWSLTTALALGLVAVSGLSVLSSSIGGRDTVPLAHVFSVRILPYPDRLDWFADQGMPQADLLRSRAADLDPAGRPPLVGLSSTDKALDPWWNWLHDKGRATFARWLLTHPGYLVTEPLEHPERTFNNADGNLDFYRSTQMSDLPFTTDLLWLNTTTALVAGGAIVGFALWLGRRRGNDLLLIGAVCVAASGPQALVAWHSDGMETARHLFMPGVQLRVGVLLGAVGLVVVLVERGATRRDDQHGRARPATASASPPAPSPTTPPRPTLVP